MGTCCHKLVKNSKKSLSFSRYIENGKNTHRKYGRNAIRTEPKQVGVAYRGGDSCLDSSVTNGPKKLAEEKKLSFSIFLMDLTACSRCPVDR